jgi:hypothetical protein
MKKTLHAIWELLVLIVLFILVLMTFIDYINGVDATNFRVLTIIMLYLMIKYKIGL